MKYMKKILSLCSMVALCTMLHATVYTFTTNAGTFKLNDQLKTVSFRGTVYKITDYSEEGSERSYVFCEYNGKNKRFELDSSKGNISEYDYIETFEWKSVAYYNKAKLISGLYRNINTYANNNNISGDELNSFRNATNQFVKGIENGTITMNGDGTFTDSTGTMSSSGTFDKKWTGRSKKNSNNAFNLVGDYAKDYINQMPTCNSNWEQVGSTYIILKVEKFD